MSLNNLDLELNSRLNNTGSTTRSTTDHCSQQLALAAEAKQVREARAREQVAMAAAIKDKERKVPRAPCPQWPASFCLSLC